MGRSYSSGARPGAPIQQGRQLNPVWRGIGCLLLIAIPIASWFAANYIRLLHFENQNEWGVPYLYDVHPYAYNGVVAVVLSLILFAVLTVLYGWIRRPQMEGPLDVRERPRKKPRRSR